MFEKCDGKSTEVNENMQSRVQKVKPMNRRPGSAMWPAPRWAPCILTTVNTGTVPVLQLGH